MGSPGWDCCRALLGAMVDVTELVAMHVPEEMLSDKSCHPLDPRGRAKGPGGAGPGRQVIGSATISGAPTWSLLAQGARLSAEGRGGGRERVSWERGHLLRVRSPGGRPAWGRSGASIEAKA